MLHRIIKIIIKIIMKFWETYSPELYPVMHIGQPLSSLHVGKTLQKSQSWRRFYKILSKYQSVFYTCASGMQLAMEKFKRYSCIPRPH